MKRRVVRYVAGACVAGMVLGAPGAAYANTGDAESVESGSFSVSEEMNVDLYGPPSAFEDTVIDEYPQLLYGPPIEEEYPVVPLYGPPIDEPTPVLYGPPPILDRQENPMQVTTNVKAVKESRLALSKKRFSDAIVVEGAKGKVSFQKLDEGSSKRLIVDEETGAVTVKKGTKKGVKKATVLVAAKGNKNYLPIEVPVVVKVRVK